MINIPDTITAYFCNISTYQDVHHADYLLPDDTESKRSVKSAANKARNTRQFDNVPMPGFKVESLHYNRSEKCVRVIDPRGFSAMVARKDFGYIIDNCTLLQGIIDTPCVWIRSRKSCNLSLIPVNTQRYRDALANTRMMKTAPQQNAVSIGDQVLTQGGHSGTYLGKYTLAFSSNFTSGTDLRTPVVGGLHLIRTEFGIYFSKRPHIVSAVPGTSGHTEGLASVRNDLALGTRFYNASTEVVSHHTIKYIASPVRYITDSKSISDVKLFIKEVDSLEAHKLYGTAYSQVDTGVLLLEKTGSYYLLEIGFKVGHASYAAQATAGVLDPLHVDLSLNNDGSVVITRIGEPAGYFRPKSTLKLSDFDKYYMIEKVFNKVRYA